MDFKKPLQKGRLLSRANRFACSVELEGRRTYCHLPNPGRLNELPREGVTVWVMDRTNSSGRRTTHDLLLVRHPDAAGMTRPGGRRLTNPSVHRW